jgi:hypothetical protein
LATVDPKRSFLPRQERNNLKTTATIQKIVPAAIAITAIEKSGAMYCFPRPISVENLFFYPANAQS